MSPNGKNKSQYISMQNNNIHLLENQADFSPVLKLIHTILIKVYLCLFYTWYSLNYWICYPSKRLKLIYWAVVPSELMHWRQCALSRSEKLKAAVESVGCFEGTTVVIWSLNSYFPIHRKESLEFDACSGQLIYLMHNRLSRLCATSIGSLQ